MLTLLLSAAIYLNGVNIDGVRAQSFEKCRSVRIDEKGDVHLDCPGYQVEVPGAGHMLPYEEPDLLAEIILAAATKEGDPS